MEPLLFSIMAVLPHDLSKCNALTLERMYTPARPSPEEFV